MERQHTESNPVWAPLAGGPSSRASTAKWLLAFMAAAHAPLLLEYFRQLWAQPHYRFFPFAIGCFAYVLLTRRDPRRTRWTAACGCLVAADLCLLALAAMAHSPWLAAVGAWAFMLAVARASRDKFNGESLGYLAALLLIVVRPPLRWDALAANQLQGFTARTASEWLHELGCLHFRAGNVLEFPHKTFLVEEACSGIQSLFTLMFIALVVSVWRRRRWLHSALLVVAAVVTAVVANIARVLLIAAAWVGWGWDLSAGALHQILGNALLLAAAALLLSFDELMRFLTGPLPSLIYERQLYRNPLIVAWNSLFRERSPALASSPARPIAAWDWGPTSRSSGLARVPGREANSAPNPRPTTGPAVLASPVAAVHSWSRNWLDSAVAWGLPWLLAAIAISWACLQVRTGPANSAASPLGQANCRREFLPERVGDFSLAGFEAGRGAADGAVHRASWNYHWKQRGATAVCDYPFQGWHPLVECYARQGWSVESQRVNPLAQGLDQPTWSCVEACLRKPSGEYGYLVFSMFDSNGWPVAPSEGFSPAASLSDRWARGWSLGGAATGRSTVQLQLFAQTHAALSSEEQQELVEHHRRLRGSLRDRFVEAKND